MEPLWTPPATRVATSRMTAFQNRVGIPGGYRDLWEWSLAEPDRFWSEIWDFCGVAGEKGSPAFEPGTDIRSGRFFPEARFNFAANLLGGASDEPAILFIGEDGRRRSLSRRELYMLASRIASALRASGVGRGDRVAGMVANTPETVAAMLATAMLGAIWASCSPDFGADGVLDRFGQIGPKVLFATTGYFYGGRAFDARERIARVAAEIPEIRRTVVWDYALETGEGGGIDDAVSLATFIADHRAGEVDYEAMRFGDPLYVLFSSGTTGKPKCIVHAGGGILLQHLKEHQLHCDIRHGDRVFFFTTCGWMMWNWLVSALATRASIVLFDGNPMHPGPDRLAQLVEAEGITAFGVSAKYLDAAAKAGLAPKGKRDLSSLRTFLSTGSPLSADGHVYVYESWKDDVHLSSISGGTDICGVFVGANPNLPVYAGEIQCPYLGLDVRVFDHAGQPVRGKPGELVCRNAHPTIPIGFWNDPDGERFRRTYFEPWPNLWRHGDWMVETERGGYIIEGRSDATLNPGGVRIGTAEIYRQVERLPEVVEALVIGQNWEGSERIVLFVRLAAGVSLDAALADRIRQQVRVGASPRHVPARIAQVADIPRTRSGKIVELAVRDVVHGREVRNRTALANPEALALFEDLPELRK